MLTPINQVKEEISTGALWGLFRLAAALSYFPLVRNGPASTLGCLALCQVRFPNYLESGSPSHLLKEGFGSAMLVLSPLFNLTQRSHMCAGYFTRSSKLLICQCSELYLKWVKWNWRGANKKLSPSEIVLPKNTCCKEGGCWQPFVMCNTAGLPFEPVGLRLPLVKHPAGFQRVRRISCTTEIRCTSGALCLTYLVLHISHQEHAKARRASYDY